MVRREPDRVRWPMSNGRSMESFSRDRMDTAPMPRTATMMVTGTSRLIQRTRALCRRALVKSGGGGGVKASASRASKSCGGTCRFMALFRRRACPAGACCSRLHAPSRASGASPHARGPRCPKWRPEARAVPKPLMRNAFASGPDFIKTPLYFVPIYVLPKELKGYTNPRQAAPYHKLFSRFL